MPVIDEMEKGMNAIREMSAERDRLIDENLELKEKVVDLNARLETFEVYWADIKSKIVELQAERDFRQRQVAEILSHLGSANAILNDAITKASHGHFRPNGGAQVETPQVNAPDKVPAFLLKQIEQELGEMKKNGQ